MTAVAAMAYSIEEIPNVHLTDKTQYVSNPDGVLRQTTVDSLNRSIAHIWQSSSAEVVAVVVNTIDGNDIDDYATALFRHWGIGKKDNNNGVLVLVSTEERKAVIRNGYGAEGILPDIICGRIIRDNMVPHFREGDYDGGMLSAVARIDSLLTTPVLWLSSNQNTRTTRSKKTTMHSMAICLWQAPLPQSCCSMCFFSHSHRASKAVSIATTVLTKSNYCTSAPHSSLSAWHCLH